MGGSAQYYDVAEFSNWKRKQGSAYKIPPRPNFLAAVNHIRQLLDGKKINWAAMGGLAMLCLGSRREMPDIHIVYDDAEYTRLKNKLEGDSRVRLPSSMNPLFPSKILISTGPKFKDPGCSENAEIELDLVPPGSHGTPPNDVLRNNQVMLSLNVEGRAINIKGLNILYLTKTALNYCKSRDLVWDPRKDLLFLCRNYGKEIGLLRDRLDVREVQELFLGTAYLTRISPEERKLCYNVLLGKEPPPSMSLTPAPLVQGRPHITPHKSSPSLNGAFQQPSGLLTPPSSGKEKPTQAGQNGTLPIRQQASNNLPPQGSPTSSKAEKESRSRYRTPNSAPNTPSGSRNGSPEARAQNASRPKSMDIRGSQQQHPRGGSPQQPQFASQNLVYAANFGRTQAANSKILAPPKVIRPQQSMPALPGRPAGNVPIYAHSQSTSPPMSQMPPSLSQTSNPNGLQPAFSPPQHPKPQNVPQNSQKTVSNQSIPQPPPPIHGHHHSSPQEVMATRAQGAHSHMYSQAQQSQPTVMNQPRHPGNTQSTFVFELDACPSQSLPAPPVNPPNAFVAELPAETVSPSPPAAISQLADMAVSPPLPPKQALKNYEDSPVSPPVELATLVSGILISSQVNTQPPAQQNRQQFSQQHPQEQQNSSHLVVQPAPPTLRAQSDPLDALPTSLTIGGSGKRRSPTNSISQGPAQQQIPQHQPKGYELLNSSSLTVNSNQASKRVSMYKAYSASTIQPKHTAPIHPLLHHSAPNPDGATTAPPQHLPPPAQVLPPLPPKLPDSPSREQSLDFSGLGAGLEVKPLQIVPRHILPNQLGAIPPTPPTLQRKHDSHHERTNEQYTPPSTTHSISQLRSETVVTYENPYANLQNFPVPYEPQQQQHPYTPPTQRNAYAQNHNRATSTDSHASTASHNSERLAQEYQMDLPTYGNGYNSPRKSADGEGYGGEGYGVVDDVMPTATTTDPNLMMVRPLERRETDAETIYDFT